VRAQWPGATRDVDLLGFGDASEDALLTTFRDIMAIDADDGVHFDLKNLRIEAIREELDYGGSRLRTTAVLAGARIPITVDIGFGDAIAPGTEDVNRPVLLDMPSPHLRAYPPETVIAEKVHAMVALRRANSRIKDYYDVWMLTNSFDLEPERLRQAIAATFARHVGPGPGTRRPGRCVCRRPGEAEPMACFRAEPVGTGIRPCSGGGRSLAAADARAAAEVGHSRTAMSSRWEQRSALLEG
jgi:hypothetical protein